MKRSLSYLSEFSEEERNSLKWKPFAYEKAIVATVTSVLKPGMTNTASISQNEWISESTKQIPSVANFINFLDQLLGLNLYN